MEEQPTEPRSAITISTDSFLSGCVAGGSGALVGHPLDTLKVRVQTGITSKITLRGLYAGLSTPLLTTGTINAVNLGIFQNLKDAISTIYLDGCEKSLLAEVTTSGVSGSLAGLCISIFTCPLVRIKLMQQTRQITWTQAVKTLSFRRAYSGWGLNMIIESGRGPYMATYFGTRHVLSEHIEGPYGVVVRLLCGAMAGMVGWISIYPFDVVRSVMVSEAGANRYSSNWACATDLVRQGGVGRLFKGLSFTLLRAGPVAAVILPLYDLTLGCLTKGSQVAGGV